MYIPLTVVGLIIFDICSKVYDRRSICEWLTNIAIHLDDTQADMGNRLARIILHSHFAYGISFCLCSLYFRY